MSIIALFLGSLSTAHAVPIQLSQQGRLLDSNGVAISGQHVITFSLHDAQVGGNQLWAEGLQINFDQGYYSALLGNNVSNPLDDSILASHPVYLEIDVNGTGAIGLRQEVVSAPYSRIAGTATDLSGGTVDATSVSIGGQLVIDVSGSWVGPAMPVGWSSIQSVPADIADGDDDTLAGISCSAGEILGWNGSQWTCAADNGLTEAEVEAFVTNGPLDLDAGTTVGGLPILTQGDGDTLSGLSCMDGELAKWDMVLGQWVCGIDIDTDTDTQLSESEVEDYITNGGIDLNGNTTLNGQTILSSQQCADGQVLSYVAATSTWECTSFQALLDADADGVMAWSDCDDTDPTQLSNAYDQDCDGALTSDDCDDYNPNSTLVANDADCDGILTADDCDDSDPNSTAIANDGDCDGAVTALDCNDAEPNEAPGLIEVCDDGYDNDCSGGDEACPVNVQLTTCGNDGRSGPTQSECDATYLGTDLEGAISVDSDGYQSWNVPETGLYAIRAYGAAGGDSTGQGYTYDGGNGAYVYGEFNLSQGQTLTILVGQEGWVGDWNDGGGGGGGTFVVSAGSPLIVAAGGGGSTAVYQCQGSGGSTCQGRPGHSNDIGEGISSCTGSYGSCLGSGFFTSGDGSSFTSGGIGGDSNNYGVGGFGGGGGAQSHPGGGGGGYHGGGCGFNFPTQDTDSCTGSNNSGGGWSHNNGSNASGTDGANNGHGYVVIEKI